MATIKHLTSKNSNYAAAESYLTFQHNEYTGLPILDEKGRPKLRDSYLLDTLECGESSFAMACLIANRKYGKNGGREDVKTHHYIVSFDPKDAVENGLTMERAQVLGLQFCKDNFPGHPAIVCTHPDGHNSAGNIHVHIVIGSLRVRTVERQPFMDKPCDWEAGKKHRCTSAMLRHLRVAVMEMCEQADLNQINLLEAQGDHVSVCGTGSLYIHRTFLASIHDDFPTKFRSLTTGSTIARHHHFSSVLLFKYFGGYGISTVCASATPFGLTLAPGLLEADEPSFQNLRLSAIMILT